MRDNGTHTPTISFSSLAAFPTSEKSPQNHPGCEPEHTVYTSPQRQNSKESVGCRQVQEIWFTTPRKKSHDGGFLLMWLVEQHVICIWNISKSPPNPRNVIFSMIQLCSSADLFGNAEKDIGRQSGVEME